jgi:hypothetical protein
MNGEPTKAQESTGEFTPRTKILFFVMGNIIPSLLLMASAKSQELRITWQSGRFQDYAAMLMSGTSGWIFYPFFIYSIAAFTLGTMRPLQVCRSRLVLFGVLTGVFLSLQTCILLGVVWMQIERWNSWRGLLFVGVALPLWGAAAIGLPMLAWWFAQWVVARLCALTLNRWWISLLMFCGPLVGLLLGGWLGEDAFSLVMIILLFPAACILAGGPFWIVAAYSSLLVRLLRLQETRLRYRLSDLLLVFAWLGSYLAAWRFAVEQAVATYATLPTTPPSNCYIATAAARGHSRFVGSFVTNASGTGNVVNAQLQFLKCGELAIKVLWPGLHRLIRRQYDRWGPTCASLINHPVAADVAYTVLKPMEWLVWLALRVLSPQVIHIAPRLYRGDIEFIQPTSEEPHSMPTHEDCDVGR